MSGPGHRVGEEALRMLGQAGDHRGGQRALTHVIQRLGIDDVIAVAGTQQVEEIEAALRSGGAEPGKMVVADLRAEAIRALVASTGIVHRDPGGARQPGAQHIAGLVAKAVLASDQQTHELPLGDDDADRPQLLDQTRRP